MHQFKPQLIPDLSKSYRSYKGNLVSLYEDILSVNQQVMNETGVTVSLALRDVALSGLNVKAH